MNDDNDVSRRTVEQCYRTMKTLVNPIIDWTDEDVWQFIKTYNVPYCGLYDEGCKRIGCVGCPLGGSASMKAEFKRFPLFKKMYIHAFNDMIQNRKQHGKNDQTGLWASGEGVFNWWVGNAQKRDVNQTNLFQGVE